MSDSRTKFEEGQEQYLKPIETNYVQVQGEENNIKTSFTTTSGEMTIQPHYDNSNGSLYKFAHDQGLNAWEFDILKRVVRCRKKGQFIEDIDKTIAVLELYKEEYKE